MFKNIFNVVFFICFYLFFLSFEVQAQKIIRPKEKSSPVGLAIYKNEKNKLYVKVTYGQPFRKDRTVFGGVVPYGKIWRVGANEATEVTFTKEVKIGENKIKAGTYTLFAIPEKDKWTILLNTELGQWGTYSYEANKDKNILTYEVKTGALPDIYEALTFSFEEIQGGVELVVIWEQVRVAIPIAFLQ
ncbi:MAG: DUF2911 domain-containing protein [Cytophagales bacterium]|nr:MAG: DUF2911 domain-containing protein [Cytophagales bacterium]